MAGSRKHDPVLGSVFDGLPDVQTFDPAWNVARNRGEAGRVGENKKELNSVLPGEFKANEEDWEDASLSEEDEEEEEQVRESSERTEKGTGQSSVWKKFLASRNTGGFLVQGRSVGVCLGDVRLIVEKDLRGEVVSEKGGEMRFKVGMGEGLCTVVVSFESAEEGVRVSVRRSFADCFRFGNEVFDAFCNDFERRVHLLRAV